MATYDPDLFKNGSLDEVDEFIANVTDWNFWKEVPTWGWILYQRDPDRYELMMSKRLNSWSLKKSNDAWLAIADERNHVRLFRMLKLRHYLDRHSNSWAKACKTWNAEFLAAIPKLQTSVELEKWAMWPDLSDEVMIAIYENLSDVGRDFLKTHFERMRWRDAYPEALMERLKADGEDDLFFVIYRRLVPVEEWGKEIITLAETIDDDATLNRELERRSMVGDVWELKPLAKLAEVAGKRVAPYLLSEAINQPRSWDTKTWNKLLDFSEEWGDITLWKELVRRRVSVDKYNKILDKLLTDGDYFRIAMVRHAPPDWGRGHKALTAAVAKKMYQTSPDLARSFISHFNVRQEFYPGAMKLAHDAGDEGFVDMLAAKVAEHRAYYYDNKSYKSYIKVYRDLDDEAFKVRATNVLSRIQPDISRSSKPNELLAYLIEDPLRFRDGDLTALIEAESPVAKWVALTVLGESSQAESAALHLRHIKAVLLTKTARRNHLAALKAMENAASVSEEIARVCLTQMRLALELQQQSLPRDRIVGSIGNILAGNVALQSHAERAVVYRRGA